MLAWSIVKFGCFNRNARCAREKVIFIHSFDFMANIWRRKNLKLLLFNYNDLFEQTEF